MPLRKIWVGQGHRRLTLLCVALTAPLLATACTPSQVQQAATVGSALRTQPVDDDHDGIDDNLEQKLAERFAPFLLIGPGESNYPVNVEWFLARAHLQYHEDCGTDIDDDLGPTPLNTQQNLIGSPPWSEGAHCGQGDTGYSHPPHRTITTIATDPDGQASAGASTTGFSDQQTFVLPDLPDADRAGSTDPSVWTTYYHEYPSADGGVMIQYWHLFAYNQLGVATIGDHGGDWDGEVQVHLNSSLQVKDVVFSRHGDDHPGDDLGLGKFTLVDGTRPLVTIDGGGHAAYASPQDFCDHRPGGLIGSAVWPGDPSNLINPATLHQIDCSLTGSASLDSSASGGIVWNTDSGGFVASSALPSAMALTGSKGGPLVNLGEYNPCTPSTCLNSRQASTLLAGQFLPLNGQVFIRYEGYWGSLPSGLDPGPPRGPVFQGMQDHGSSQGVTYTAWYNNAATQPASAQQDSWLAPPVTKANDANGTVTLTTTANPVAQQAQGEKLASGALAIYYRTYAQGATPPGFQLYVGPFSLPSGQVADFFAVDQLGDQEQVRTING